MVSPPAIPILIADDILSSVEARLNDSQADIRDGYWLLTLTARRMALYRGRSGSTGITKLQVHAEVQVPRKTVCKTLAANDNSYALAA